MNFLTQKYVAIARNNSSLMISFLPGSFGIFVLFDAVSVACVAIRLTSVLFARHLSPFITLHYSVNHSVTHSAALINFDSWTLELRGNIGNLCSNNLLSVRNIGRMFRCFLLLDVRLSIYLMFALLVRSM